MKVQYQLVDVETKRAIPVSTVFELVGGGYMDTLFDKGEPMSWLGAVILCGDPLSIKNPVGILGTSPIEAARRSLAGGDIAGTGHKQPTGIIHYGGPKL